MYGCRRRVVSSGRRFFSSSAWLLLMSESPVPYFEGIADFERNWFRAGKVG